MATIRQRIIMPAQIDVNLAPFDRFGGRGGRLSVKATAVAAEAHDKTMTVMVGSDILADQIAIGGEAVVGLGPNRETPTVTGIGAPADPITVRLFDGSGTGIEVVTVEVEIENA